MAKKENPNEIIRMVINKLIRAVIIVGIVMGGYFLFKGFFQKKPMKETPARPVEIAVAFEKDSTVYLETFGNLYSLYDVDVKAQIDGQIKEINFTEGTEVKKGDLLVTIDPAPFEAELDKARASLNRDLADLKLRKVTFERNKVLFEKKLISQQDFDKYSADLASSEAQVRLDAANVDIAKINLEYCYVRSSVDGLTGKHLVDAGNIVKANDGPTLVNIKAIDELYVDFTVTESDLDKVREAMKQGKLQVEFYGDEPSAKTYSGELSLLNNSVDNTTGTFLLRAIVSNKERELWAGQFVKVRLILGIEKAAVQVPYDAVQLGQSGSYLFVVSEESKALLRQVKTGNRQQNNIVIEEGVKPGEKVVISGQLGLSPGATVVDIAQLKAQEEKIQNKK